MRYHYKRTHAGAVHCAVLQKITLQVSASIFKFFIPQDVD